MNYENILRALEIKHLKYWHFNAKVTSAENVRYLVLGS